MMKLSDMEGKLVYIYRYTLERGLFYHLGTIFPESDYNFPPSSKVYTGRYYVRAIGGKDLILSGDLEEGQVIDNKVWFSKPSIGAAIELFTLKLQKEEWALKEKTALLRDKINDLIFGEPSFIAGEVDREKASEDRVRSAQMLAARRKGESYVSIGKRFGVSTEHVHHMVAKEYYGRMQEEATKEAQEAE